MLNDRVRPGHQVKIGLVRVMDSDLVAGQVEGCVFRFIDETCILNCSHLYLAFAKVLGVNAFDSEWYLDFARDQVL